MYILKKMYSCFFYLILFNIIFLRMISAQAFDKSSFAIKDSASAIQSAIQYTGFDKSEGFSIEKNIAKAELITAEDTMTPCLWDRINGRTAWLVVMENIYLNLKEELSHIKVIPRKFEVLIDAQTGQLLKIHSPPGDTTNKKQYQVPREEIEKKIKNQFEDYIDFVDTLPKLSFYNAANISTYANPHVAKEIDAILIRYSISDKEPVCAWVITLFGMPPFVMDSDVRGGSEENLNRRNRVVINANTGKILLSSRNLLRIEDENKN